MHEIIFYQDKKGREPVYDYLKKLSLKKDKDSRIKNNKIHEYINVLKKNGLTAGLPYIKHIEGDIWELRPLQDRIFFVAWVRNSFVLLHNFVKKTRKTPRSEIEKAKRELKEFKEMNNNGL